MVAMMWKRILELSSTQSLFLFGARGTGKTTLLSQQFPAENTLWVDLLDLNIEDELARHPQHLEAWVKAASTQIHHIVIDEIQKVPRLLDVVQRLMSTSKKQFVLTGSSAKKLRHGAANLLAGRAFVYNLYPFTFLELGEHFNLADALQFGSLPRIFHLKTAREKQQFLTAYALTYLKEEVWSEQLVKKLDPFRRFLEISAQMNGKILNFNQISRETGVDDKTIYHYYEILQDTLLGFYLEPFHSSFRKRLTKKPKFYFIDIGIVRALSRNISLQIKQKTSYYGDLFEAFVIAEIYKLINYYQPDYQLSYLQTKDDLEIDLILERPGKPLCLIEIKSTALIVETATTTLQKIAKELDAEAYCFSNDPQSKQFHNVHALFWQIGIKQLLVET